MRKIFLITISGRDKPGLMGSFTGILSAHGARILDIGQAVIHETLSLGILIETAQEQEPSEVKKDLIVKAHELNVHIGLEPITEEDLEHWVKAQQKDRFIITLLGRAIRAQDLASVGEIIARHGLNIDRIERLSGRQSLSAITPKNRACVQLRISGWARSPDDMRAAFLALTHDADIDIAFERESIYRRNRRLVAFDMDSTLIQGEVIDELAKLAGAGEQVARITEAAMRGELDFKQSFAKRVSLLHGLNAKRVKELIDRVPLTDGAETLIATLKKLGYKTAILSGGFTFFGRHLQAQLGIDYLHANELQIADGVVTGEVGAEIVDGKRKAELLREIARKENLELDQVIAIGDGANDLPMLNIAGLGIAFHAKPLVRMNARHAISHLGLDGILYLIGVRDRDSLQP